MISLDLVRHYIEKAGLLLEFSNGQTGVYSIKIYDYSATAQAGYEYRLMYNDRSRKLDRLLEDSLEWALTHIRKVRESNRA